MSEENAYKAIRQGDLEPALVMRLYRRLDDYGRRAPLDLTDAESVMFQMRKPGQALAVNSAGSVVDATGGDLFRLRGADAGRHDGVGNPLADHRAQGLPAHAHHAR